MNVNDLAQRLGDACYVFLTMNFLWGLYCVVATMRRVKQLRFQSEVEQSQFLDTIQQHLKQRAYTPAMQMCENDQRALPQLVLASLQNRHWSLEQIRQFLGELVQRDIVADLDHRISWIATSIKNGPLLGLFGTVLGMMAAFGRIGQGEKVEPAQIADEISVALICTAMGLATAIPFGYFLSGINVRVRMLQDSLSAGLMRFLTNFK